MHACMHASQERNSSRFFWIEYHSTIRSEYASANDGILSLQRILAKNRDPQLYESHETFPSEQANSPKKSMDEFRKLEILETRRFIERWFDKRSVRYVSSSRELRGSRWNQVRNEVKLSTRELSGSCCIRLEICPQTFLTSRNVSDCGAATRERKLGSMEAQLWECSQ